ncbi:MAG: hypothetical protein VXY77_01945 [Pseudomonadota bacterium]|nr:hypothetical protein [Pseudomonadota bacterium]
MNIDNLFNSLPSPLRSLTASKAGFSQNVTQHNNQEAYDEGRAVSLRLQYTY